MAETLSIRIGNQTAFSAATLRDPFDYALANDFDAFEWFPDRKPWGEGWDENNLAESARREIRHAAAAQGMSLSVHARWPANPLAAGAWLIMLKDIELAADLGAGLLNIHLHVREGIEAYLNAVAPLADHLAETGLRLAIENTPETTPEHFNELFTRLREVKTVPTDHVGMCLDIGHANLCANTRNDYLGYFDRLDSGVPLIHLHAHENWGDSDSHLPLFCGPAGQDPAGLVGLIDRLRRRRYSGSVILEQWPHPPSLLNRARDGLLRLIEAPDE